MIDKVGRALESGVNVVRRLRHYQRRKVAYVVYSAATIAAYMSAYFVRFEFVWPTGYTRTFLVTLPLLLVFRHGAHVFFRLTTSRWRFVGVPDVVRLVGAVFGGTAVFLVVSQLLPIQPRVPLSVVAIESLLSIGYVAGAWIAYRLAFETVRYRRTSGGREEKRVLIVGAGESGYMLAREMLRGTSGLRPVGFADDDVHKWGTRLAGIEVIGATDDLEPIVKTYRVEEIILAVPHATPAQMRSLVPKCEATGLRYRVLPSIGEVLKGNVRVDYIRDVQIEDLLGREPVNLELAELAEDLSGGCVLITGAAGSIGSELARQIARHGPDTLIILDQAETALFYLQLELEDQTPEIDIVPIVGDVTDSAGMETLFLRFSPTHVFHAAAYKHVPMMEGNVPEAIRNNVLGSYNIADAAGRHGVRKFVLVSTDKAVKPTSVMGASKRLAEVVTLELQEKYPETVLAAVRFGNVLGSNGSVIPIFRRQIATGRPLTVTHPDVTRYFMTIPEAVQLILQASLLPEIQGHIAMLEMGEPVRIVDLAENLLRLSGIRDSERIVFTGLRPGEKLHEELVAPDEETVETAIRKVRLVKSGDLQNRSVLNLLPDWQEALREGREWTITSALADFFPDLGRSNGDVFTARANGRSANRVPGGQLSA